MRPAHQIVTCEAKNHRSNVTPQLSRVQDPADKETGGKHILVVLTQFSQIESS